MVSLVFCFVFMMFSSLYCKELISSCLLIFLLIFYMYIGSNECFMSLGYLDNLSSIMMFLVILLTFMIKFLISSNFKLFLMSFSCLVMFWFFFVDSLLSMFIMFELSLIPMLLLIVGYGVQPERMKAGRFMFIYTMVASSSLLISLVFLINSGLIWFSNVKYSFSCLFFCCNSWLVVGLLMALLVKVPLFFVHSWLPKAHVEAPLEGSMILAGVMLKMGLYGLMRFIPFMSLFNYLIWLLLMVCFLIGSVYSCWMALTADDLKMIVGYSSVSHMNFCMIGLLSHFGLGFDSCLLIMISHGFCSSSLFFLVTLLYTVSHSRSIMVNKGSFSIYPLMNLLMFFGWSLNMACPPSISFVGEVFSMTCLLSLMGLCLFISLVYVALNSFFSMLNYGLCSHSPLKVVLKSSPYSVLGFMVPLYMFFFIVTLFFFLDLII